LRKVLEGTPAPELQLLQELFVVRNLGAGIEDHLSKVHMEQVGYPN